MKKEEIYREFEELARQYYLSAKKNDRENMKDLYSRVQKSLYDLYIIAIDCNDDINMMRRIYQVVLQNSLYGLYTLLFNKYTFSPEEHEYPQSAYIACIIDVGMGIPGSNEALDEFINKYGHLDKDRDRWVIAKKIAERMGVNL